MTPHLILVGGFLGAGKTTLILTAARLLAKKGLRCAIIANDQGESLVDTELARSAGFPAAEVTGGCFCCRFSELMRVAETLRESDVIFAEPAGSCTDLSATILHPIQQAFAEKFQLAPLTVLVDPGRPRDHPDIDFLLQKQIDEADLVCYTKSDLYPDESRCRQLSGLTGQGVAAWLDEVMSGQLTLSGKILDIDTSVTHKPKLRSHGSTPKPTSSATRPSPPPCCLARFWTPWTATSPTPKSPSSI